MIPYVCNNTQKKKSIPNQSKKETVSNREKFLNHMFTKTPWSENEESKYKKEKLDKFVKHRATNEDINVKGIFWFGFLFIKEAGWDTQVNIAGNSILDRVVKKSWNNLFTQG